MSDFRDIVGTEGLEPDEEARLRRVHDLLVQAGPPPDLPPALERTPEAAEAEIVQFPLLPRRRWMAVALAAATVVALVFGGGYLFGHSKGGGSASRGQARRPDARQRRALADAQAIIRISSRDTRRQLADGDRGDRTAEAAAAGRLLRALADEGSQAGRALRRLPRARRQDDRPLHDPVRRCRTPTAGS